MITAPVNNKNYINSATYIVAPYDSVNRKKAANKFLATGTNDQNTLQDAIDALHANGRGKIVIADGNLSINGNMYFYVNTFIEGMGGQITNLQATANLTGFMFNYLANAPEPQISVGYKFADFSAFGGSDLGAVNTGFLNTKVGTGEIQDGHLSGLNLQWWSGDYVIDVTNPWGLWMLRVIMEHNDGSHLILRPGTVTSEIRSALITNCNFRVPDGDGVVLNGVNEILLLGNEFSGGNLDNTKYCIKLINSSYCRLLGNTIDANWTNRASGVLFDANSHYNVLDAGNVLKSESTQALAGVVVEAGAVGNEVLTKQISGYATSIIDNGKDTSAIGAPSSTQVVVESLTQTGNVATAQITGHGRYPNETIKISGADQSGYNVTAKIIATPTADTFTFAVSGNPTSPATGTIKCTVNIVELKLTKGSIHADSLFPAILANANTYLAGMDYEPSSGLYLNISAATLELHYRGVAKITQNIINGNIISQGSIYLPNAAAKTTPVDADTVGLFDSAASNIFKKVTWSNIKATLNTYFGGIFATLGANSNITSLSGLTTPLTIAQGGTGNTQGTATAILRNHTALVAPADTNENTLWTGVVPGGSIGANGRLLITALFSFTNSTNAKTLKIKLDGSTLNSVATSTAIYGYTAGVMLFNRNSESSQLGTFSSGNAYGSITNSVKTYAIDTSIDQTITITGQKASAGEDLALEAVSVEVLK